MYPMIRSNRSKEKMEPVVKQERYGELEYLTFPELSKQKFIRHLFTTRTGGVSVGDCATLNLSFSRGDDPEAVLENYRRICTVLHTTPEHVVASVQTHTTTIRRVTGNDLGKGVIRPVDYQDVDGLITDEPGIALACFYADCVPLYFADPVNRVIGLAHSGWRGTVERMGAHMVRRMQEEFGSKPEDLITAIGPSICRDCYEVSEDVALRFRQQFPHSDVVTDGREEGKYQLDLWLANQLVLLDAGITDDHISVTDVCTCHNPGYLFSHRASHGRRGNLAAFLMIKEDEQL